MVRTSTGVIPVPAQAAIGGVVIDGLPAVTGATLTAHAAGVTPAGAWISWQWYRDGVPIPGAVEPSYTVTDADAGHQITARAVVQETGYATASRSSSQVGIPLRPCLISIAVDLPAAIVFGQPLAARVVSADPAWAEVSWQWLADGTPVAGATGPVYQVRAADVAPPRQLSVRASATADGRSGCQAGPVVVGTAQPAAMTGSVSIVSSTSPPTVGQTLAAVVSGLSPANADVAWQWFRDGQPIPGATGPTYVVTSDDAGHAIGVSGTSAPPGHHSTTWFAEVPSGPGVATLAAVWIHGPAQLGGTLTAQTTGLAPANATLTWQWLRDGQPIPGAIAATHALTADDVGHAITAAVTAAAPGRHATTWTPAAVVPVPGPLDLARPVIAGDPGVGRTLSASLPDPPPAGTGLSWKWYCDGQPLSGADQAEYALTEADQGCTITVRVTGAAPGRLTTAREADHLRLPEAAPPASSSSASSATGPTSASASATASAAEPPVTGPGLSLPAWTVDTGIRGTSSTSERSTTATSTSTTSAATTLADTGAPRQAQPVGATGLALILLGGLLLWAARACPPAPAPAPTGDRRPRAR